MESKTATDNTFGLYDDKGKFFIGDSEVTISDDDITIGDDTFKGTPGLWELLASKNPNANICSRDDHENYENILLKTNAIIDPSTGKVKSSSSVKYNTIIKPIYDAFYKQIPLPPRRHERRKLSPLSPSLRTVPATATLLPPEPKTGKGVTLLPRDPNALVEMPDLRMASHTSGNTGVTNEIVDICNELLREKQLSKKEYKAIMSLIEKHSNK